jgi:hypothetical protein
MNSFVVVFDHLFVLVDSCIHLVLPLLDHLDYPLYHFLFTYIAHPFILYPQVLHHSMNIAAASFTSTINIGVLFCSADCVAVTCLCVTVRVLAIIVYYVAVYDTPILDFANNILISIIVVAAIAVNIRTFRHGIIHVSIHFKIAFVIFSISIKPICPSALVLKRYRLLEFSNRPC